MCFSAIAGLASGIMGANAAGDAADAQVAAAMAQLGLQQQIYDETTERFEPFYEGGLAAHDALLYELGLGERPVFGATPLEITEIGPGAQGITSLGHLSLGGGQQGPGPALDGTLTAGGPPGAHAPYYGTGVGANVLTGGATRYQVGDQVFDTREEAEAYAQANATGGTEYQGFTATPGYEYRVQQGIDAIDNSAAARGNLYSGATLEGVSGYVHDEATREYNNYLNQLYSMSSTGQASAANQANAGANFAAGGSAAYANMGNAQAAGAIGQYNALMGGLDMGLGLFNYQNSLSGAGGGGIFSGAPAAGAPAPSTPRYQTFG